MGTGDGGTSTKNAKATTSTPQEQPTTPPYPPDWAAAFQAYYGAGTPPRGFFPPTVASGPQPHPYIWGGQPMMTPYGTPPPHAMYPYGGVYAHPSMTPYGMPSFNAEMTVATNPANAEMDTKNAEGKATKGSKGSLGSLGMLTGKGSASGKATSGSANGHPQSGDSGIDNSSDGSEEDESGHDDGAQLEGKEGSDQLSLDGGNAQGCITATEGSEPVIMGKPSMDLVPGANLNVGVDYWGVANPVPLASVKGKHNEVNMGTGLVPAAMGAQPMTLARNGMPGDLWLQDDRELKRQRRKQSNRESARRSRLRKQAECEDLSRNVDTLTVENMALRTELEKLAEECKKLSAENASLLEQLEKPQDENGGRALHQSI